MIGKGELVGQARAGLLTDEGSNRRDGSLHRLNATIAEVGRRLPAEMRGAIPPCVGLLVRF